MRKSRTALIALGCIAVGVSAWAQAPQQGANTPAAPGANKPAAQPGANKPAAQPGANRPAAAPGPAMMEEQLITTTVSVDQIDKKKRTLTVRTADGERITLNVPADAQNFDRLKKGDKIEIDYQRSMAVAVMPKGAGTQTGTQMRSATTEGAGAMGRQITATTQVVSVNTKDNTITVKGQNGSPTRTMSVQDPALQKQMQNLKAGDVVQVTFTEAVAARIRPQQK